MIINDRCAGCKCCILACYWGAIYFEPVEGKFLANPKKNAELRFTDYHPTSDEIKELEN